MSHGMRVPKGFQAIQTPQINPCHQESKEDPIVLHLQLCCWSLARAIEIMDCSGLVMTRDEATEPRWIYQG
jgi:hypothetical protein